MLTFSSAMAVLLTACATDEPLGGPLRIEVAAPTPRVALQRIAAGAARCWKRGAISGYAVVPELDTEAGNPRILLIEKGNPAALPSLVIEARPMPVRVSSFGPLASEGLSSRINDDVIRWSTGADTCG